MSKLTYFRIGVGRWHWVAMLVGGLALVGCGGGGGGGTASPPTGGGGSGGSGGGGTPSSVTISGAITFDRVPHNANGRGLNYNNIRQDAARGIIVQAVSSSGSVLGTDTTDSSGRYSIAVDANTDVRIQARSEMRMTTGPTFSVDVMDNTSSDAIYVLQGNLTSSGTANSTRNLNAGSGWGGSSYTGTRAAAPFAILDSIYKAKTAFGAVDSGLSFPDLNILWSVNNRPSSSRDIPAGEVGTSSYSRGFSGYPGQSTIIILGAENDDTDEYDEHVVVHEWGHYFEDRISRSDSIGGGHSPGERLDMRLAFGEGWGNALAAMILDPVYRDAGGNQQSGGFEFSIESDAFINPGWFNEANTARILYDVFDSNDDGSDTISGGLAPIYGAFTDADFTGSDALTSIFSFSESLSRQSGISTSVYTSLLNSEGVNSLDAFGVGETNNGGVSGVLPVYQSISAGGADVTVCSTDNASSSTGNSNKLGVYNFLRLNVPSAGSRTITMTRSSGPTGRDPDFRVYDSGSIIGQGISGVADTETQSLNLSAGDYAIATVDFLNANPNDDSQTADTCFTFSVN